VVYDDGLRNRRLELKTETMPQTLEELTLYIRQTIPQPKSILHLKPVAEADAVRFVWNGREFLVRTSLQTLEIKNNNLFVTGSSMLMQIALTGKTRIEKVLGAVVENIQRAEEFVGIPADRAKGITLLSGVKQTLRKLIGNNRPSGLRLDPARAVATT